MPPEKTKAGKGGVIPPARSRFSSTRQPSAKAKSEGLKKWHDRHRLKDDFSSVFAQEILLNNGNKITGYEALAKKLLKFFLDKTPDKMTKGQAELMIRFLSMITPAESKLDLHGEAVSVISQEEIIKIMAERGEKYEGPDKPA